MTIQSTRRRHTASPRWWQRWHKPVQLLADPAATAVQLKASVAQREAAKASEPGHVPYLGMEGGHIEQRPGSDFHDTLLAPCNPHPQLSSFAEDDEVRINDLAGDAAGFYGRISRIVPWRAVRPIGVRIHAVEGWGRLLWCEPHELEKLSRVGDDTLVLTAPPAGDDAPLMGGASR